ncbi:pimelyl-[acyl-carrier protein] methyl ester esterase [Kingella potus]|uniref:Pimelyl-[acyl-carrier protein] methyl ester esterase n=1 Tax=Kingella potus TaxID=265175 RepID=A0A377R3A8_9NEIS|nr:alpha/beta fold hydrolase [Kingella potus]STR02739.1 pimelyl-[acyl-carrier protein] methyl ester esterase [Kingella potus]
MNGHILLLHGIHMHAWIMFPFARLLEKQGFAVETFGYYSVWQTHERHTAALADTVCGFFRRHPDTPLHLVGHSLGGLVLRRFAAAHPDLVRGRIVTLGTPHSGSAAAEAVRSWGAGVPLLGGAYRQMLDGNLPPLPAGVELGSIAGSKPMGVGRIFGLHGANDGTVAVAETRFDGMAGHIVLPVSHTGMLADEGAAAQTAAFLRHGRFAPEEAV